MTYHNATEILLSDKILQEADVPFIREVPYSWNFLMENFFDPAHTFCPSRFAKCPGGCNTHPCSVIGNE